MYCVVNPVRNLHTFLTYPLKKPKAGSLGDNGSPLSSAGLSYGVTPVRNLHTFLTYPLKKPKAGSLGDNGSPLPSAGLSYGVNPVRNLHIFLTYPLKKPKAGSFENDGRPLTSAGLSYGVNEGLFPYYTTPLFALLKHAFYHDILCIPRERAFPKWTEGDFGAHDARKADENRGELALSDIPQFFPKIFRVKFPYELGLSLEGKRKLRVVSGTVIYFIYNLKIHFFKILYGNVRTFLRIGEFFGKKVFNHFFFEK